MASGTLLDNMVEKEPISARDDFIAGAVAGFVVKLLEYPLDTIKVRLQTQTGGGPALGPLGMLAQTVRNDGVARRYKGTSAPRLCRIAGETNSFGFG